MKTYLPAYDLREMHRRTYGKHFIFAWSKIAQSLILFRSYNYALAFSFLTEQQITTILNVTSYDFFKDPRQGGEQKCNKTQTENIRYQNQMLVE